MVRAILDGTKSQTRRIVNLKRNKRGERLVPELLQKIGVGHACPKGAVGDQLYVRETWLQLDRDHWQETDKGPRYLSHCYGVPRINSIAYRADTDSEGDEIRKEYGYKWRPSIFLPRWASRVQLEITGLRIERVQDISEQDAIAEGFHAHRSDCVLVSARDAFRHLWYQINGKKSWNANPWVWVIGFKRIPQPVTQAKAEALSA